MTEPTTDRPFRIYVTLLGERRELVLPGYGWSYKEAKLAKAVSASGGHPGMAPVEIGQAFLNADPDAVMAIIRVTLFREGVYPSTTQLAELEDIDLEAIAQATLAAFEQATEQDGNGASPTQPATAGSQKSGPPMDTASVSPETPLEPGASPENAELRDEPPTEAPASAAIGAPSSDTS